MLLEVYFKTKNDEFSFHCNGESVMTMKNGLMVYGPDKVTEISFKISNIEDTNYAPY